MYAHVRADKSHVLRKDSRNTLHNIYSRYTNAPKQRIKNTYFISFVFFLRLNTRIVYGVWDINYYTWLTGHIEVNVFEFR